MTWRGLLACAALAGALAAPSPLFAEYADVLIN